MTPRLKILTVGGNPISAFLTWRLQATNACDVTLVWKSSFDHVSQYGLTFKSPVFGNERFKPRHVVKTPEDATATKDGPFDYIILCVKALPDIYDLSSVIDSVVTPQHSCIIVNTTHALGVEAAIEERFPTNVVLSLVSGAELSQLGQSEFEHRGSPEIWVGPANKDQKIPTQIQEDMAQALAMTLCTSQVDCKVSPNIRQQQYERVIGPIAFHPASVIFETPSHAALLEKVGVRQLVSDVVDELVGLATAQGCKFPTDFKQKTIEEMAQPTLHDSIMYQDFLARRPMEVETYLGSPIKSAQTVGVKVPRIETLYSILYNLNLVNRTRPKDTPSSLGSPSAQSPLPPRISSQAPSRNAPNGILNGNGMGARSRPRGPPPMGGPMPPGPRRPPMNVGGRPSMNGHPNGYFSPSSRQASRRGSMEGADLEEFSHLVLFDDIPETGQSEYGPPGGPQELALRERELQLRQRELALREREMTMGRRPMPMPMTGPGPGPRRGPPSQRGNGLSFDDDDNDDDDYFDSSYGPPVPMIDPDNFDMMSVTSKKNRKVPSASEFRKNPDMEAAYKRGGRFRPNFGRGRSSQVMASTMPSLRDNILNDPMLGYSSNRYGNVDRGAMHAESRANSLTASRLDEMQLGPGGGGPLMNGPPPPPPPPPPRRTSQSPANIYSPSTRGGRPSPPDAMRQTLPRHPSNQGNSVAPPQAEQHLGVSFHQSKNKSVPSLTGSASASAGSGDSTRLDSENSAHSSQSSLGPRPPIGVR